MLQTLSPRLSSDTFGNPDVMCILAGHDGMWLRLRAVMLSLNTLGSLCYGNPGGMCAVVGMPPPFILPLPFLLSTGGLRRTCGGLCKEGIGPRALSFF